MIERSLFYLDHPHWGKRTQRSTMGRQPMYFSISIYCVISGAESLSRTLKKDMLHMSGALRHCKDETLARKAWEERQSSRANYRQDLAVE